MAQSIVFLILSLGIIVLGSELFTNAIEWFGHKLRLTEAAVGGLLAAVGTAMPETMVPIIAIVSSRGETGREIAIGAILGAPLMLATLAFFITGLAVFLSSGWGRRTRIMTVDPKTLGRDLKSFIVVYSVAIGAAFLSPKPCKVLAAIFVLGAYAYYVRATLRQTGKKSKGEELSPLHIHRRSASPGIAVIVVQVVVALALIIGGAEIFVRNLAHVAISSGVSALVLATIITPIATELPEKCNSVIWIFKKKDTLALGNISGALVFQASIPTAIGLLFTSWILSPRALSAAVIALGASAFVLVALIIRRRLSPYALLFGILFYAFYVVGVWHFSP